MEAALANRIWVGGAIATMGLISVEGRALAIDCNTLPNPVFLQVGDTQEPLMKKLGQKLRANAPNPITIIYKTSGSCTNIDAIYNDTKLVTNPSYVPSAAEDPLWDSSKPSPTCVIDPAGVSLDVANSNVFIEACTATPVPAGLAVSTGPVQPYVFVVPEASTQTAILAEEAYFTFGFGAAGMVDPWNDEAFMFIRPTTKSTLLSIAANIQVPAAKWKGVPLDKSSDVLNAVATSTAPETTIGILGAEVYDGARDKVNALAYRAYQQKHAYYPDASKDTFDKQNVRDGHYTIWSPTVYIQKVDGGGSPTNAKAAYIIDLILGNVVTPAPNFDSLDIVVSGVKLVPDCAMKVKRAGEGGDLSLYDADQPCGCFFDSKLGVAPASCTVCTEDTMCGAGKCRHGFCEAK